MNNPRYKAIVRTTAPKARIVLDICDTADMDIESLKRHVRKGLAEIYPNATVTFRCGMVTV